MVGYFIELEMSGKQTIAHPRKFVYIFKMLKHNVEETQDNNMNKNKKEQFIIKKTKGGTSYTLENMVFGSN